jgi:hypothetical protein
MCDFATPGRGTLRTSGPTRLEHGDWRIVADSVEDPETRTLERRMEIEMGGQSRVEVHHLNLYDPSRVRQSLERAGFSVAALDRYGDLSFWPGYAAFAATKP